MGQYYKFLNLDKKQKCERAKPMLKLTEHSYLGNDYCDDILSLLANEWKGDRVIHVGDYAEGNDGTTTEKLIDKLETENNLLDENLTVYDWGNYFTNVAPKKDITNIRYVYNLDKKEFVDLLKQPVQWFYYEKNNIHAVKFNSFALLIGCGNEQGGGDYYTINKNRIGLWAGDKFVSSIEKIKDYETFTETKYVFNEMLPIKNKIKNYNEQGERKILLDEGVELKHYLDYIQKYEKINFSKLKLYKENLLDDEYKYLNGILNKYIDKEFKKVELNEDSEIETDKELE